MHFLLPLIICCGSLIVDQVSGVGYCYAPVAGASSIQGQTPGRLQPDCPPGTDYTEAVQLCCATTRLAGAGADLVQTYPTFPVPLDQRIPAECRRALHIRSMNTFQCPASSPLCTAGQGGGAGAMVQHVCCPNIQICNDLQRLTIEHRAPVITPGGQICIDNIETQAGTGMGHVCGANEVFDEAAQCCVRRRENAVAPNPTGALGTGVRTPGETLAGRGRCQDRAVPGRQSDCPANQALCDDTLYRDLMTVQCPFTCKRCGQRPANFQFFNANVPAGLGGAAACTDRIGPNGQSDCPAREPFCRQPIWRAFMRQECPFTCKVCTGTGQIPVLPALATTMRPALPLPADLVLGNNRPRT